MYSFWTMFGVINQVAWLIFCLLKKNKGMNKIGKVRHRYKKPIACDLASKSLFFEARLGRQRRGSLRPRLLPSLSSLSAIAKSSLWAELGFTEQREKKSIPYSTD